VLIEQNAHTFVFQQVHLVQLQLVHVLLLLQVLVHRAASFGFEFSALGIIYIGQIVIIVVEIGVHLAHRNVGMKLVNRTTIFAVLTYQILNQRVFHFEIVVVESERVYDQFEA
jgi:hypothetical protein